MGTDIADDTLHSTADDGQKKPRWANAQHVGVFRLCALHAHKAVVHAIAIYPKPENRPSTHSLDSPQRERVTGRLCFQLVGEYAEKKPLRSSFGEPRRSANAMKWQHRQVARGAHVA